MIGLDTNIVVRYLMQDDPTLSPVATRIFETVLGTSEVGFLSSVVIAELAWVLGRVYRLTADQLASAFETILLVESLVVEAEAEVYGALVVSREGSVSFTDAFIGLLAARAGCTTTLTFDRKAARFPSFTIAS